jgi:hypothetical protein
MVGGVSSFGTSLGNLYDYVADTTGTAMEAVN